ncbi:uncharacterized protein BT62DRAFT_1001516 [Guyanagaster necrorhizus]|uniref:BTB domain-containing protein n=1 Tax=Guyanagaster necrorhizus TaxID=856835 RepID=A0A9P8AWU8_9AGAR|nr:uncharacterized protein BT62DRAFT_1001516 [Guyanagaster necrorhizus MCA 3950]KAG7450725.1 hypothetical protein BT62DRAFT_1001516 [Guyanagaster necrorhizus MCA 3950]
MSAASVTDESLGLSSANVALGALPFPSLPSRRRRRMNSPLPSPQDLQSHLYHAFLDGKTADVALRISGSWHAVYHLHRVVLIQSEFFRSLFTAGFVEASPRLPSHYAGPDEINIVFDDHNITRAAFEVCVSRLYGGGPPLHVCPCLRPTFSRPLTPGFPYQSKHETPPGHQAATPQFLLSLLATSIYLSIPSLASQALSSICGTLGPYTVIQYLNFSLGKCTRSEGAAEGAVGLESVAELLKDQDSDNDKSILPSLSRNNRPNSVPTSSFEPTEDGMSLKSHPASTQSRSQTPPEPVTFHYGAVSDKIGEAAAAWLSRWGPDILSYEEKVVEGVLDKDVPPLPSHPKTIRRRAKTLDSAIRAEVVDAASTSVTIPTIPVIWRRGGLSPHWVKALISSDSFFARDEMERYDFAKRAVKLRRKQGGIDSGEEAIWKEMFETGIYYANMVPEDIIKISSDVCPTTEQPYVSLSVLQAANWSQTLLRHDLTFRPTSSTPTLASVKGKEKDIGITFSRDYFLNGGIKHKDGPFYLVPVDQALRIGENGGPSSEVKEISMEQLFAHSHSPYSLSSEENLNAKFQSDKVSSYPITFNQSSFFGLLPNYYTPTSIRDASTDPKAIYSPYPPFRFSVEFWDTDHLKEKKKLHSQTIWYAGSLFNVYIQVMKKESTVSGKDSQTSQLGIYLCRQSTVEAIPARSAPNPLVVRQSNDRDLTSSPSDHSQSTSAGRSRVISSSSATSQPAPPVNPSPLTPTHSTTPSLSPSLSSSLPSYHSFPDRPGTNSSTAPSYRDTHGYPYSLPYTLPGTAPSQPYRDPRSSVSAYFMIYCANPIGSSQTRYKSSPDVFKISQSWGWKSSSLKGEDKPVGDDADDEGNIINLQGSKVSLRATVVLGIV